MYKCNILWPYALFLVLNLHTVPLNCNFVFTYRPCLLVSCNAHVSWKHMHGSTCVEVTHVEQNTHALTRKNLLTESIALYYTNILLAEQHNVTYCLFSSTHIKSWWIFSIVQKFWVKYMVVLWIKLMCLMMNLKQFYCLAHAHKAKRNGKWLLH